MDKFNIPSLSLTFGFLVIFFTLFLTSFYKESFFTLKLKNPDLTKTIKDALQSPESFNLAEFLSFETVLAADKSVKFAKKKKSPQVNSSFLFYFLISDNKNLNFIFSRVLLNIEDIKKILKTFFNSLKQKEFKEIYSKDFQDTIIESLKIADKKGHSRIEKGDMLAALAKHDLIFKKILIDNNLKVCDIENLTWWLESLEEKIKESRRFWDWKNLIKKGSIAKAWSAGYTITLDKFSDDISETVKKAGFPEIIGHKKEIKSVERILSRREINNCLLVGRPGVGRKSIILELANRSVLGLGLSDTKYKRMVQLDLTALLTQIKKRADLEPTLDRIFQETVSAGNIVLIVNNFHDYIAGKERPGIIDISGVLGSYLHLPQFQIVAVTTYAGLHRHIEQNPSVLSLFEKVEVPEVSERETLMILEKLTPFLEKKYKKFISFPALQEITLLAKRYISDIPFPKSAMDLLDEVMVYASSLKDKVILPKHVDKVVSEKAEVPVGEIEKKEKEVLLSLEKLLHKRIINQDKAVNEVSSALRRARAEVTARKGPMGTFLFLGPTGVGKTETAKALTEVYFGLEEKMIRIDMSEFQNINDIPRLIGSPGEEGLLTTEVRENPFSLILLDEIEKAHPNILNLFLQVLDEGFLTDGMGRKIDFKNTIIIATSNAGYQVILEALKQKTEWIKVKEKILDYLFEKSTFRPEFINRFDGVIVFSPLSKENLLDIAELMLQGIKRNLEEKGIDFEITLPLKEKIVELGYSPTFGARQMRRVIQDKVENVLALGLLSGEIKRGERVEIDPQEFKLLVN